MGGVWGRLTAIRRKHIIIWRLHLTKRKRQS